MSKKPSKRTRGSSRIQEKNIDEPTTSTSKDQVSFPVVGIGASAGGLDAFKNLFQSMPEDTGMAFVLVQHLDPNHESMMTELLSKYTKMRVVQIENDMLLEPDTLFMIPPNKALSVHAGRLKLTEPVVRRGMRLPIDFFFRSMSESLGEKAICIVLSGTGSDGTLGIKAIKGEGGTVFVQEPGTAEYDGMPSSAIATGIVDFVLPVEKMPSALIGYVQHTLRSNADKTLQQKTRPDGIQSILSLLKVRTNQDFRFYKQGTMSRRILRRMGLKQIEDFHQYLEVLRNDSDEVRSLLSDLLIGVTSFFRDPDAWQNLEEHALKRIISKKGPNDHIRVWVTGCSSGEEAFSLAIVISELQLRLDNSSTVQIFASDIDEHALEVARSGIYPESIAADITPERLNQFFVLEDGRYRVSRSIRDLVVFANQNLVRDPPFSRVDLISCRNLLIYLDSSIQKRIISLLHFALNEDGHLFLGSSESVAQQSTLFDVVSKQSRIYRRIGVSQVQPIEFPLVPIDDEPGSPKGIGLPREPRPGSVTALAHEVLLREYVPALALVNRRGEAVYYHGPISRYLEFSAGEPTRDIAEQAKDGLGIKVRSALQRAFREKDVVRLTGRMRNEPDTPAVLIVARPMEQLGSSEGLLLLTFDDKASPEPVHTAVSSKHQPDELQQLEYELKATREDLQSTIEEMETSNEELKASNEEVMSMNEELQSSNEKLETSKDELQSLNEELITVNNQLQDKVQELEQSSNDMANLLNGTNVATLFLDRELLVRRFTPNAALLFRLIPADVGRPLEDIAPRFEGKGLVDKVKNVLSSLQPVEQTVQVEDGRWFLGNIQPYRTEDDRINGVVLTYVDISEIKRIGEDLQVSEERWRYALEAGDMGAWSLDLSNHKAWRSLRHDQIFGYDELLPHWTYEIFLEHVVVEDREQVSQRFHEATSKQTEWFVECRIRRADGDIRWISAQGRHFGSARGQSNRMLGLVKDITTRKLNELQLVESERFISRAMNASLAGVYIYDRDKGHNIFINDRYTEITGYPLAEINKMSAEEFNGLFHPDDVSRVVEHMQAVTTLDEGSALPIEYRFLNKNGHWVWCLSYDIPFLRNNDGEVIQFIGTFLDITEQKKSLEIIAKSEETHRLAMAAACEGIWDWDFKTNEIYFNRAWGAILGEEKVGSDFSEWEERIHPEDRTRILSSLHRHFEGECPGFEEEYRLKNNSSDWTWVRSTGKVVKRDREGKVLRMVGTMQNITEFKENEEKIWRQANYDSLTGLANRHLFRELLNKKINSDERNHRPFWLMFLDLDEFKQINDNLGHIAGDQMLEIVAGRLQKSVRDSDIVARVGGDEFVIVLSDISEASEVDKIATNIIHSVEQSCNLANQEIFSSISIGIANFPKDAKSFDELLSCADQALYASKRKGKQGFSYFTKPMQEASRLRMQISNDIKKALANNEFQVYFQPIIDLRSNEVHKAEALVRWNHPQQGVLTPEGFIPLAEKMGLIMEVGEIVFETVLSQLLRWQKTFGEGIQLSTNLSPTQLNSRGGKGKHWLDDFKKLDLPAGSLILEITESVILEPEDSVNESLLEFRNLGIDVAIDDFGTGYSSLSYLKEFDIDYLKIDQSFVKDLQPESRAELICESTIAMAHKLGIKVIAEGIETSTQYEMLKTMDCDFGQGFFISRPIPGDDFEQEFLMQSGN